MRERPEDYENKIDFIEGVVGKYFPIYKTEVEFDIVSVYVRIFEEEKLEEEFDRLRRELVPQNYIPFLTEERGENVIKIKKQEDKSYRGIKTNVAMLFITLTTALIAGTYQWGMYRPVGGLFSLHNLAYGALYFTLPLLTILGIHEMGHYFMARFHKIKASLPFFLPAPPPLGTIGAFISIREPIPDKKSLLDVGIAGPIAGFIVAIPVSIIGLYLGSTGQATVSPDVQGIRLIFNLPIIMLGFSELLPWANAEVLHPTLFAGWVGFLVTGLNLLPASQLDGGHVTRALFGEKSKYVSYAAFGFLLIVGIWKYFGWLLFAFIILFLGGVKHPPPLNDITKLDKKRKIVGAIGIVILLISFNPIPVNQQEYSYGYQVELQESEHQEVLLGENVNYTFTVTNQVKNVDIGEGLTYNVSYSITNESWSSDLLIQKEDENRTYWQNVEGNRTVLRLGKEENRTCRLRVEPTRGCSYRTDIDFKVVSNSTGQATKKVVSAELGYGYRAEGIKQNIALIENDTALFKVNVTNRGRNDSFEFSLQHKSNESWGVGFGEYRKENITVDIGSGNSTVVPISLFLEEEQDSPQYNLTVVQSTIEVRSAREGSKTEIELIGIRINR